MYSEITFTTSDGTRYSKYFIVAENVYERNKIVSGLLKSLLAKWKDFPLFEIWDLPKCYNA